MAAGERDLGLLLGLLLSTPESNDCKIDWSEHPEVATEVKLQFEFSRRERGRVVGVNVSICLIGLLMPKVFCFPGSIGEALEPIIFHWGLRARIGFSYS